MKKSKSTKRALLASALSMLLCLAMLIGSTFAWFTDSVTSGKNRIVAGNLDVELAFKNAGKTEWTNVVNESTDDPKFFVDKDGGEILWEPGVMAVTQFKVSNVGSLALKYSLKTIKAAFNETANGEDLSDVIKFAVISNDLYDTSREQILNSNPDFADFTSFTAENNLLPEGEEIFTVVAYWKPNVVDDNIYNINNGKTTSDNTPLYIDIEIKLVATQTPSENDSFDKNYDQNAWLDLKMKDNGNGTYTNVDEADSLYVKDNSGYVEVKEDVETTGLYTAVEGSDKYVATEAALTAATSDAGNVTLIQPIEVVNTSTAYSQDPTFDFKVDSVIDLNEKPLSIESASGQNGIKVSKPSVDSPAPSVTFSNGTITMNKAISSSYPVVRAEKTEVTLDNMTVELTADTGTCVTAASDGGKVIIKNTTVKGPNTTYSNAVHTGSQSTLEFENATVIGGVRVENNGNIIIKSGDFTQATFYFGGSSGTHIVYAGTFAVNPKTAGFRLAEGSTVAPQGDIWVVTAG